MTDTIERTLDLLEASGDKVFVAFDVDGRTHKLPEPMTAEEARHAIAAAVTHGATRVSIDRFER